MNEKKLTLVDWKEELKNYFETIRPYLIPTKDNAEMWWCPKGCLATIIKMPDHLAKIPDEFNAVCDNDDCDKIPLTKDDIKLYKIKTTAIPQFSHLRHLLHD